MSNSTALAARPLRGSVVSADMQHMQRAGLIRVTESPAEVLQAHESIAAMVAEVLVDGTDYGEIPGTDGKKALLKPGVERLAFSIGASIELDVIEQEIDHNREVLWRKTKWEGAKGRRTSKVVEGTSLGLYRYVVKARLVRRTDGALLGEGIGSCSTMESKYIDRPRDSENTVLKMAKKRASVDAVLTTLALSGRFVPEGEPPVSEEADEDGAVKDPTDGLTLARALAWKLNNVELGQMSPRALAASQKWLDGKLAEEPGKPQLVRLNAMLAMVRTHRDANPLPEKEKETPAAAAAAPAPPAKPADDFSDFPGALTDDDDDDDPFA